jgi:RHS repeat-associated protein
VPTCEGSATTSLGWDGQYTSSDTGLVYLGNRVYDPATAQFLSVDPAVALTREPYAYGGDNPVNRRDPDGLSAEGLEGVPCYFPFCGPPAPAVEGVQHGIETVEHGIESVWNAVNENEGPNDEGEAVLKEKEVQRECGERNPAQDKKLSPGQIKKLKEAGFDPHELKLVECQATFAVLMRRFSLGLLVLRLRQWMYRRMRRAWVAWSGWSVPASVKYRSARNCASILFSQEA